MSKARTKWVVDADEKITDSARPSEHSAPDGSTEQVASGSSSAGTERPGTAGGLFALEVSAPVTAAVLADVAGREVLAAAGVDGSVWLADLRVGADSLRTFAGHTGPVLALAVGLVDSRGVVVSGGEDGFVRIWWADTGEPMAEFAQRHPVTTVDVGYRGGATIVVSGDREEIVLRRLSSSEAEIRVPVSPGVTSTAWLDVHDTGLIATASADGVARLWDLGRGTPAELMGHQGAVTSIAAAGGVVVGGGADGALRAWDAGGRSIARVEIGSGPIQAVAAAMADGATLVVTGGDDGVVRGWDSRSGKLVELCRHDGPVRTVAVGPYRGRPVAVSGGDDAVVRVARLPIPKSADKVEWLSDAPSVEDLLGRRPLARAIAERIARVERSDPGSSFLVHVDGPWGTGKSTLVRYLRSELEKDAAFVVVEFDAWRESGVGPPWWALLTALREEVRQQSSLWRRTWLRMTEAKARLRRVGAPLVLALLAVVVVVLLVAWRFVPRPMTWEGAEAVVKSVTAVATAIGAIWAGALVASRFLLWDSARGARSFEQSNTNPMLEVRRHFQWLSARSKAPVVIVIDDLDRCPGPYVVELLDSIQTLIRSSAPPKERRRNVHVVVAADGAWIRAAYEMAYEQFATAVAAPGQPLGYLFLDKFFQLRVHVPSIDAHIQDQFLRELLGSKQDAEMRRQELAREVGDVQAQLRASVSEAEVMEALRGARPQLRGLVAEDALLKLTEEATQAETEHSLQRFAPLLPPNPRTMKRFINTYGALRAVRTLEGNPVRMQSLALWAVLEIRWPSLADHLRTRPESIALVGKSADLASVPEDLRPLFVDPALDRLIGFDREVRFDADAIRSCCGER